MELLAYLVNVFQASTFSLLMAGLVAGIVLGATPGLSSTFALAVMLPVTLAMGQLNALVFLGAVLMGSTYGGAFASILLNTPGTPQSVTTTFDGFPMAKRGDGDLALTIACLVSAFGGFAGVLAFVILAPPLAHIALQFGPPEMFWLALFGLTIIGSLSRGNLLKGLISGAIGLAISMMGIAIVSADARFTFGLPGLAGGVHIIPATVGLLCLPVLFDMLGDADHHLSSSVTTVRIRFRESLKAISSRASNLCQSTVAGTLIGILPGAGGAIASIVAYSFAKKQSVPKSGELAFGEGNPGGIIASESANNATVGGGLVPTLVLGIPGSPPDAVILAAMLIHGLQIGPSLFTNHGDIVYSFSAGMLIASVLLIPVGLLLGRLICHFVMRVTKTLLIPLIAFMTIVGAYSIRNNYYDVVMMMVIGVLGWILSRLGFPTAPIVLGFLLGPIAEQGFSQAYMIGSARNDVIGTFLGSGISIGLVTVILFILLMPLVKAGLISRKGLLEANDLSKTSGSSQ